MNNDDTHHDLPLFSKILNKGDGDEAIDKTMTPNTTGTIGDIVEQKHNEGISPEADPNVIEKQTNSGEKSPRQHQTRRDRDRDSDDLVNEALAQDQSQDEESRPIAPSDTIDADKELMHSADPHDANQQKASLSSSQSAMTAISYILSNTHSAGAAVNSGEFQSSGSGSVGSLFRAMDRLNDEDGIEIWGDFISMTAEMWDSNEADASLSLMETANLKLNVPEMFHDRVQASIGQARDMLLARRVEIMFDEGNDDGAEKLAAQLISKDGDDYKIMLQMRTKYRKRLRMIAFGIAGLVMIILSTMVISGVHQVITLTHNLPGLSLPETPDFNPIREIATQIRRPTQLVTVGIDGQPPIEDAFNAQATKSDLTDTPDVVLPDQNSPDVDTGDPSPDVVKNTPEVDYTGDIQICAIGRLVVASATETVLNAKNIAGARKVDAFSKKVSAACKRIPVPESVLLEAERDIVGVDIAKMAASIISQ